MGYCLHEAPTIRCELLEEFWATAKFKEEANKISFICKGKSYNLSTSVLGNALRLPENKCSALASDEEVRRMLNDINYVVTPSSVNLGEVARRYLRREWSYFFDSIIKVFSGKVSNFDAIKTSMQLIPYNMLYDKYFDLSNLILTEIGLKLGKKESRENKIYFARFIMIAINHLVGEVVLDRVEDKLNCWTQSNRVFQDLVRIDRNSSIELTYPPLVQVFISTISSSQSQSALPSTTMEGAIQHPPTQVAKPSKTKSKSTTSSVSQKTGVAKTTRTKIVGSVKEKSQGEGTKVHQQLQKDKVSEAVEHQPSHSVPSQKGTEINKEINTSLVATSQKVPTIEKGSHPGTQNKGMDTDQTQHPKPKMFERRKKPKTMGAHGTHTAVQSHLTSETELLHKSVLDASPINVEKLPHSLNTIPTPQSNISTIDLIDNPKFLNSPSLQLREEPILQKLMSPSRKTSFLNLLNTESPNIEKITTTFTSTYKIPPTDNIQSTDIISSTDKSSSMDIPHPLIVPSSSTDIHQSMDSPTELINQVLLGMREVSDLVSERQA